MKSNSPIQLLRVLGVLSIVAGLVNVPRNAGAQTCGAATVWTSPSVVHHRTVIRDSERRGSEPNFTAFIELSDGSAGDIDQSTCRVQAKRAAASTSWTGR